LKASTKKKEQDPGLPAYQQAMTGQHRAEFEKAMMKEIRELEKKSTWHAVLVSTLPAETKVVPLTWVFRIKRLPNSIITSFLQSL
jgi:hypothetical protein